MTADMKPLELSRRGANVLKQATRPFAARDYASDAVSRVEALGEWNAIILLDCAASRPPDRGSVLGSHRRNLPAVVRVHSHLDDYDLDRHTEAVVALIARSSETTALLEFNRTISESIQLEEAGRMERAIDRVYEYFDGLLRNGKFIHCDMILKHALPNRMTVDITMTILTVTLPASHLLQHRSSYFARVKSWLEEIGVLEDNLLVGLD